MILELFGATLHSGFFFTTIKRFTDEIGPRSRNEMRKMTLLIIMADNLGLVDLFYHNVRTINEGKGTNLLNRESN